MDTERMIHTWITCLECEHQFTIRTLIVLVVSVILIFLILILEGELPIYTVLIM